ncbi:MAG: hypothetical protein ABIB47_02430 [Candidatus Woesearchaeota archaeon]
MIQSCPNCNYVLVLLERRLKYKCALCSKLYPKKEIENRNFRIWNEKQRDLDKHNLSLETKKRQQEGLRKRELARIKRQTRARRVLFNGFRRRSTLTLEERRRRKYEANKRWYRKNPEKVRAMNKRHLEKHRGEIYDYLIKWRKSNQYESRIKQRLAYWRGQQKKLTVQLLKNKPYKLYSNEIQEVLPTSALSQLLNL